MEMVSKAGATVTVVDGMLDAHLFLSLRASSGRGSWKGSLSFLMTPSGKERAIREREMEIGMVVRRGGCGSEQSEQSELGRKAGGGVGEGDGKSLSHSAWPAVK